MFTGRPNAKTVQLRHTLPDGSSHIDWLLATGPAAAEPLICFRLDQPVHTIKTGDSLAILRIADHRAMYLDYEGPVSGDRGEVRREAAGTIRCWQPAEEPAAGWLIDVQWLAPGIADRTQRLLVHERASAERTDAGTWWVVTDVVSKSAGLKQ